jgi:putative peptidoglycan lipid II flippase
MVEERNGGTAAPAPGPGGGPGGATPSAPLPEPVGAAPEAVAVAGGRALGGAALAVALATLGSKLLGFLRDTILAGRFGSTDHTDTFVLASTLPLVLFAAVGVAITTVFIPLFAERLAVGDRRGAEGFAANVNGAVTLTLGLLIVLLEAAAGPAVRAMVPTWPPAKQAEAADLARIMAPLIMFYGWSGIVGGVLNVRGFFGPNAAMGIPQNLVIIAAIVLGSRHGRQDIYLVAWGSLVGTFTTYLIQLPALWRSRFRVGWRLDLTDPLLRRMGRLVVPAALTALGQQAGNLVINLLGARLPAGQLTDLTWATRIQMLAYTILGMSVATVLYPSLAAAAAGKEMGEFRRTLAGGLGLVNLVTVPVTAALWLLRVPVVRVLFGHGRFTWANTLDTAAALEFLTLGTLAFGWQDYLNRVFFALQDTRTPMRAALAGVGVNVVLAFFLVGPLQVGGLGLSMALGWVTAVVFLVARLRRRMGPLGGRQVVSSGLRMVVAAGLSFGAARLAYGPVRGALGGDAWHAWAAALVLLAAGGAAAYGLLCRLLRVPEMAQAAAAFRGMAGRLGRAA